MEALIHFCADIGGRVLVHGSPHQRTVQEGWRFDESWDRAKETFEACLETARRREVIYCIEPLSRSSTNFVNTVSEAIQMVKEIRHPNFRMVFDCRCAASMEKSIPEALIRALDSRLLHHIHVKDATGKGPGLGETKFFPILKTLVKNGYKKYISVEVHDFDQDPQTIASRSIGYLRGILEALTP
jgi:sugar phosphate isomerase/epimerase